ncbi:MAG: hypothetical protein ASUL_08599 [Candidatus Aramenus sulfurataquae]|uniref:EamA domain-containing protein n=1 Tax=Candidatus Aramenus sulfurataquae TaxID=1326980 RepID=W7L4V8_9CREN|nr:MAG: hypothetical protein ASUL_08599 [Candidatus Aramenus sulfurataquae]
MDKRYLLLVLGGISFGTASIFIKFSDLSPGAITFFRFLVAGLVLSLGRVKLKDVISFLPYGLLLEVHMVLFVESVYTTSISDATVLVSTSPIFALFLSSISKAKPKPLEALSAIVAVAGVALMNYPLNSGEAFGNALALASAFAIALYTSLLGRRGVEDPLRVTSSIYLASSIFALPLFAVEGFGRLDATSLLSLLGLIALPTLLGHTSVVVASGHVKPHVIETIGLLEPVVASVLAFFLFGQVPSTYQLVGEGIVLTSVGVVVVEGRK